MYQKEGGGAEERPARGPSRQEGGAEWQEVGVAGARGVESPQNNPYPYPCRNNQMITQDWTAWPAKMLQRDHYAGRQEGGRFDIIIVLCTNITTHPQLNEELNKENYLQKK